MKTKRFFAMLLALLMFAGLFAPVNAQAATSGKCGKNVKWNFASDGTLTISGTGAMYDYDCDENTGMPLTPWSDLLDQIKKVVVKDGVTYIGSNALTYANMEGGGYTLSLSASVTKIGPYAFTWSSLMAIDIPDTVTEIGEGAFLACQFSKTLKISKNIKEIPNGAFSMCAGLVDVTIPSGVTKIGNQAFGWCDDIKTITLPSSVKSIGVAAFYSDIGHKVDWVCFKGTKAAWNKLIDVDGNNMLTTAKKVYCKPGVTTSVTLVVAASGNKATMTVKATGTGLSYKWYYKKPGSTEWLAVSKNGTSATYSLTTAAKHNGYIYRCKVTNKAGTTYGKEITLITAKPKITSFPTSVTKKAGKVATFTVAAVGATKYQWQYKKPGGSWTNVSSNGSSATYKLTTKAKHDGYLYRCKVSNSIGTTTTDKCKLTVY